MQVKLLYVKWVSDIKKQDEILTYYTIKQS